MPIDRVDRQGLPPVRADGGAEPPEQPGEREEGYTDAGTRPEAEFDAVDRFTEPDPLDEDELTPEVPEPPDPGQVSERVAGLFWALVVIFNAALLATAAGLMVLGFRGDVELGGSLLTVGVLLFAYGAVRYRGAKAEVEERLGETDGEGGDDEGASEHADGGSENAGDGSDTDPASTDDAPAESATDQNR